jgi:hypothetical protein
MKLQILAFLVSLALHGEPAHAQSTLDKYLKKAGQGGASVPNSQADPSIVFESPDGYWRLDDTRSTGGFCAMTYFATPSFAGYVGPVVGNPDSFVLFGSPTIPPIKKERKKKVTLTTGDGTVQSVKAFHLPNSLSKDSGVILFRLTDIQAAVSEMSDEENLNIVMDNELVFSLNWTGGRIAQEVMQTCLNKKGS